MISFNLVLFDGNLYFDETINSLVRNDLRDIIFIIKKICVEKKWHFSTSIEPIAGALNVVAEGLTPPQADKIKDWCSKNDERINFLQTENFQYSENDGVLQINGKNWYETSDSKNSIDDLTIPFWRIESIVKLIDLIDLYIFVGDGLDCTNFSKFTPQIKHLHLQYPKLSFLEHQSDFYPFEYDLFFSLPSKKSLTPFREQYISTELKHLKILVKETSTLQEWIEFVSISRNLLHLPKSEGFIWPSSYRIWMGAYFGKFTYSNCVKNSLPADYSLAGFLLNFNEKSLDSDFFLVKKKFNDMVSQTDFSSCSVKFGRVTDGKKI